TGPEFRTEGGTAYSSRTEVLDCELLSDTRPQWKSQANRRRGCRGYGTEEAGAIASYSQPNPLPRKRSAAGAAGTQHHPGYASRAGEALSRYFRVPAENDSARTCND